jgi:hypothetical protein
MTEKRILTDLPGVVIADAEVVRNDEKTVLLLKQTRLYRAMEDLLGSDEANVVISADQETASSAAVDQPTFEPTSATNR